MVEFLRGYRRILLAIGGTIMAAFIPLAIAQEYFLYNPYVLPILGLVATLLFLAVFLTGSWWSNIYHKHIIIGKASLICITILIIFSEIMWIRASINYVAELKLKDLQTKAQTKALLSTFSPKELRGLSKEEVEILVKKLIDEHIKEIRKEASREKFVLPRLGEKAVLKLGPLERPELEQFTLDELKAIPRSAHAKILKNQVEWLGYADIADAAVKAHEGYERSIFGGEEAK